MENKNNLNSMPYLSPLTDRMDASKNKGFTENYEVLSATTLVNYTTGKEYAPLDVKIVNHYRFEGVSDQGDNNILYELETSDGKLGVLVTPYGPDCPAHVADFVAKIPHIEKLHAGASTNTEHAQTPLDVTIPSNTTMAT